MENDNLLGVNYIFAMIRTTFLFHFYQHLPCIRIWGERTGLGQGKEGK